MDRMYESETVVRCAVCDKKVEYFSVSQHPNGDREYVVMCHGESETVVADKAILFKSSPWDGTGGCAFTMGVDVAKGSDETMKIRYGVTRDGLSQTLYPVGQGQHKLVEDMTRSERRRVSSARWMKKMGLTK